jgi:AmmeMemoRadiSam system protein B
MWWQLNLKRRSLILFTCLLLAVVLNFIQPGVFQYSSKAHGAVSDCLQPLFAGHWYEKDPEKLRASLNKLFSDAAKRRPIKQAAEASRPLVFGLRRNMLAAQSEKVIAAIVPHASYQYSGATAAAFYELIRGQKISRVFILGPAHREHFHGCALPINRYLCSPLGQLPVDAAAVQSLRSHRLFSAPYDSIKKEHSIEMQLPLIQQSLGVVPIVPLEIGQLSDMAEVHTVAKTLRKMIGSHDLIVVSSDFTHYGPRYKFEPFDKDAVEKIRNLDTRAFDSICTLKSAGLMKFQKETHDTICGLYPCAILLAMLPAKSEAFLLDYENSSSINKAPDGNINMVSYMAIVFKEKK